MDIGPVYDCYRIFPYFMELMFSLFIATIIFFLWMEIFKILFILCKFVCLFQFHSVSSLRHGSTYSSIIPIQHYLGITCIHRLVQCAQMLLCEAPSRSVSTCRTSCTWRDPSKRGPNTEHALWPYYQKERESILRESRECLLFLIDFSLSPEGRRRVFYSETANRLVCIHKQSNSAQTTV